MKHLPKFADAKGRILLGKEYANDQFIIKKDEERGIIILQPAVTVAVHEKWLYENANALKSVSQGLEDARKRKFVSSPINDEDESWIDELSDE